eukprot:Hpha_TRINITY_DN34360_c0_g1::TRINITY_DN34360_c0_g1_i1::g.109589::m.109589
MRRGQQITSPPPRSGGQGGSGGSSKSNPTKLILMGLGVFAIGGWLAFVLSRLDHFGSDTIQARSVQCGSFESRSACVGGMEAGGAHDGEPCVWCCGGGCALSGPYHTSICAPVRAVQSGVKFDGAGEMGCSGSVPVARKAKARRAEENTERQNPNQVQVESGGEVEIQHEFASGDAHLRGRTTRWRGSALQEGGYKAPPPTSPPDGAQHLKQMEGVGCLEFTTRNECISHRDGRSNYANFAENMKIYKEPCIWCCGDSCVGDDGPYCEPRTYARNSAGFSGHFESAVDQSTCSHKVNDPLDITNVADMSEDEKEEAIKRMRKIVKGGPAVHTRKESFEADGLPGFDPGVGGKRPRLPPEAIPYAVGSRPKTLVEEWTSPPPPDPSMFDMSLSEEDRTEALTERIEHLREQGAKTKDDAHELGALLMVSRKWQEAVDVLKKEASRDPKDVRTHRLLGHALEGLRYSGMRGDAGQPSEESIRKAFKDAFQFTEGTKGSSDWGNDTHMVDVHHGGPSFVHPRPWPEHWEFRKSATETVGEVAGCYEILRLRGLQQPELRALYLSTGDEPQEAADNLRDLADRFAQSDVIILKGVLPGFVRLKVAEFYKRWTGKCHHSRKGFAVRCDEPEYNVFGKNPNDPHVFNAYSDRVGFWLNQYLRPLAEAIAGRRLNPTYAYLARYTDKPDGLQAHTDQVDNEYTMSMQLEYTPEDQGPCTIYVHKKRQPFQEFARNIEHMCPHSHDTPNPYCKTPGDSVGGGLALGDAVLFRGRQHIHYRPRWPKGRTCMSVLSHFSPREVRIDRGQHNDMVCCAWPPLDEYNKEDCECSDPRKKRAKRSLKKLIPRSSFRQPE